MSKAQAIDAGSVIYRRKHAVEVPEPMIGWCIVELKDVEMAGGLFVPGANSTGMDVLPDENRAPLRKARVVKAAKQYPVNATTLADTPFGPGDYILTTQVAKAVGEPRYPVMLPENHLAVWIADVAVHLPCPMDQSRKGES